MTSLKPGATRVSSRKGLSSAPAPLEPEVPLPGPADYAGFLQVTLPQQEKAVASHRLAGVRVWLKKAGPRHGMAGYRAMALLAALFRLEVIKPVPNPGGEAAVAIEARRLRQLAEAGLLLSDLGESGRNTVVLQERLEQAANAGPAALVAAWREGLDAIAQVHARGCYLSQAFDRNLVVCPDGVIGYIDFEDDPGETLGIDECQARDWLSYLHSTAMLLHAAAPLQAGAHWHEVQMEASEAVRERLLQAARRMRWLRRLPKSRRWGRDTQRVRAAASLLARWYSLNGKLFVAPTRY